MIVDFDKKTLSYKKNEVDLGIAISNLPTENGLYAAVSLFFQDDEIEILNWKKIIKNEIFFKNILKINFLI